MEPLLEFRNVSIARGERVALHSLNLKIALGEHTAILGPNGSGKSTLIKAINRECYPLLVEDDSWVRLFGRDRWNVFDLRSLLGIVTQDLLDSYKRDFTGREAILSGFFSSVGVWPHHEVTAAMRQKADEILHLLEVEHLADRTMDELSSGEARRLVIGRALVHDPKALLLDEPTNSLDLRALYELRDIMRKLARRGITLLLVTHHLPDVIPEIGRVVLLKEGRVFRDGAKEEALTSASLSELFGLEIKLHEEDGYYHIW
ncbi:MAG: ABC transporter ATP-binding protein [Bryobacteraceae bacterium]